MSLKGSKRLADGYITGMLEVAPRECDHCGHEALCVHVTAISYPPGIKSDDKRIIPKQDKYLGTTCGCYGKAHRQLAHINERRLKVVK